jgi:hypothetical protein
MRKYRLGSCGRSSRLSLSRPHVLDVIHLVILGGGFPLRVDAWSEKTISKDTTPNLYAIITARVLDHLDHFPLEFPCS